MLIDHWCQMKYENAIIVGEISIWLLLISYPLPKLNLSNPLTRELLLKNKEDNYQNDCQYSQSFSSASNRKHLATLLPAILHGEDNPVWYQHPCLSTKYETNRQM